MIETWNTEGLKFSFAAGEDADLLIGIINQGIDAYLEAVAYTYEEHAGRGYLTVKPEGVATFMRRLAELAERDEEYPRRTEHANVWEDNILNVYFGVDDPR